jgi:hypothetical protein
MKKILIATSLVAAIGTAQAVELTVSGGTDWSGADISVGRVSVGVPVKLPLIGSTTVAGEYTYGYKDPSKQYDQYALTMTKEVLKVGPVSLAGKVGVGHIDLAAGNDGTVGIVGATVGVELTKSVVLEATLEQRYADSPINATTDTTVGLVGIKVRF